MKNLWSEKDAAGMSELDRLVYQSRLIGADPSLVLWGSKTYRQRLTGTLPLRRRGRKS